VLVTDADDQAALAIIRSLGRAGYTVLAASGVRGAAGFRSRYNQRALLYPRPSRSPLAFVGWMERAVLALEIDLVIPVSDAALLPLASARARLEQHVRLALPDNSAISVATNKRRTVELAARLGIPVPAGRLVREPEEAIQAAQALGYPVVLKPARAYRFGRGGGVDGHHTVYVDSPAALRGQLGRLLGAGGLLMQEYVPGNGVGVEVLARAGEPVYAFQHRRLRELPVTGGASTMRESMELDDQLLDYVRRLLAELRWTGLGMVEFKVGPQGPMLMEINGRPWGSLPLAVTAGADFPRLLAELFLHDELIERAAQYRPGVRVRNLELELLWALVVGLRRRHYPPRRAALSVLADLLRPDIGDDFLIADDPLPGLVHVVQLIEGLARRLLR
jgi:predicted ATP-grasp superfamily ATP-dependent carboligase